MSVGALRFEARDFARGFVAALVTEGVSSFQPMNEAHRHGLYRVWGLLENRAQDAKQTASHDWYKALIRIYNRVSPGEAGAFDQFQTDLRDLQLSITSSPNPSHEDISFGLDRSFAESIIEKLETPKREIIIEAARVFLGDL